MDISTEENKRNKAYLAKMMLEKDVTQKQLAKLVGCTPQHISQCLKDIEHKKANTKVSNKFIKIVADVLGYDFVHSTALYSTTNIEKAAISVSNLEKIKGEE